MLGWLVAWVLLLEVRSQGSPPPSDNTEFVLNIISAPLPSEGSEDWVDPGKMEVMRINETHAALKGCYELKKGLDKCTLLLIKVNKYASGKMESVFTHEVCDVCDEIGNPDSNYYSYIQYFILPETCPCDPDEYCIKDMMVDTSDMPITASNAGDYQVNLQFYKLLDEDCNCKGEKQLLGGLTLECAIEAV